MKARAIQRTKPEVIDHGPGFPFDSEEDSPELEAELLKAFNGPFTPYSGQEMRAACECALRKARRK